MEEQKNRVSEVLFDADKSFYLRHKYKIFSILFLMFLFFGMILFIGLHPYFDTKDMHIALDKAREYRNKKQYNEAIKIAESVSRAWNVYKLTVFFDASDSRPYEDANLILGYCYAIEGDFQKSVVCYKKASQNYYVSKYNPEKQKHEYVPADPDVIFLNRMKRTLENPEIPESYKEKARELIRQYEKQ
jgi:tetratricopeptide (TPR) repeat protein